MHRSACADLHEKVGSDLASERGDVDGDGERSDDRADSAGGPTDNPGTAVDIADSRAEAGTQ